MDAAILDLRDHADARAFAAGVTLTADERARAIEAWTERMRNEHVSARVFAALLPQCMAAGVSAARQAEIAEMIAEELRHGRLCASVVVSLGGDPAIEYGDLPPVPTHDDAPPVEALLRNVLSICCLSETVAVGHIEAERAQAGPPELQAILDEILADEIGHARFGWRLLDELAPTLDRSTRARLSAYLVAAFRQLLATHAFREEHRPSEAALSVAACDGPLMHDVFMDTVSTVILPGLDAHGFDASGAFSVAWEAVVGPTPS